MPQCCIPASRKLYPQDAGDEKVNCKKESGSVEAAEITVDSVALTTTGDNPERCRNSNSAEENDAPLSDDAVLSDAWWRGAIRGLWKECCSDGASFVHPDIYVQEECLRLIVDCGFLTISDSRVNSQARHDPRLIVPDKNGATWLNDDIIVCSSRDNNSRQRSNADVVYHHIRELRSKRELHETYLSGVWQRHHSSIGSATSMAVLGVLSDVFARREQELNKQNYFCPKQKRRVVFEDNVDSVRSGLSSALLVSSALADTSRSVGDPSFYEEGDPVELIKKRRVEWLVKELQAFLQSTKNFNSGMRSPASPSALDVILKPSRGTDAHHVVWIWSEDSLDDFHRRYYARGDFLRQPKEERRVNKDQIFCRIHDCAKYHDCPPRACVIDQSPLRVPPPRFGTGFETLGPFYSLPELSSFITDWRRGHGLLEIPFSMERRVVSGFQSDIHPEDVECETLLGSLEPPEVRVLVWNNAPYLVYVKRRVDVFCRWLFCPGEDGVMLSPGEDGCSLQGTEYYLWNAERGSLLKRTTTAAKNNSCVSSLKKMFLEKKVMQLVEVVVPRLLEHVRAGFAALDFFVVVGGSENPQDSEKRRGSEGGITFVLSEIQGFAKPVQAACPRAVWGKKQNHTTGKGLQKLFQGGANASFP